MSIVVRGGVAVARRLSVDTTGFRIAAPPILPFPTHWVRLRNTGATSVNVIFEEGQFALAPSEVNYVELGATGSSQDTLELPLEIVAHRGASLPPEGLWLRSQSGTNIVEALFFQKR